MQNSIAHGRRVAVRIVLFQLGVIGLIGSVVCVTKGWASAAGVCYGGGAIAIGNALFAWRLFADGVAPMRRIARAVYAAEVSKWVWLMMSLYFAFVVLKLVPAAVIAGVVAAQAGYWVAVGVFRS